MQAFHKYGLIGYWSYQIAYLHGCPPEEAEYAAQFVEAAERRASREPLTEEHRKNLIVVLAESLGSWPIGLEIDGTEATPFMNSLARDTSVIYFPRVLPQVKDGRSSDAQLMLNTGLLPLESGAAASLYGCPEHLSFATQGAGPERVYLRIADLRLPPLLEPGGHHEELRIRQISLRTEPRTDAPRR